MLVKVGGQDATKQFNNFHNVEAVLRKYGDQLYVGDLASAGAPASAPASAAPAKPASAPASIPTPAPASRPMTAPGAQSEAAPASSPVSSAPAARETKDINVYGEMIPYGDPNWYQGWNSNYYNDSHRRFRFATPLSLLSSLPSSLFFSCLSQSGSESVCGEGDHAIHVPMG